MNQGTNDQVEVLAEVISELLSEDVTVSHVERQVRDGVSLFVVEMSYLPSTDSSHRATRIHQTGIILQDDTLQIPRFALWPHFKGILGKLISAGGDMPDINFDDSLAFSNDYHLFAWNEEAVRILFSQEVRNYLARAPGWTVRGDHSRILVLKAGKICKADDQPAFINDSFEMLALFRKGEKGLDEQPQVRRSTEVADVMLAAQKMGGFQGAILRKYLNRIAVTNDEIEQFLAQPKPRKLVPMGLRRQCIGDAKPLIAMGVVLLLTGVGIPILFALVLSGTDRYIGLPVGAVFLIAGALTLFLSIQSSRRKHRIVCEGDLTSGHVTAVERTNTEINSKRRYHLHLAFEVAGVARKTQTNIYSGIEQAKVFQQSGKAVRILVDPLDADRVICVDTLVITE